MSETEFESTALPAQRLQQVDREKAPVNDLHPFPTDVVDRVACRAGDESCAAAHASLLSRATESVPGRAGHSLLHLQRNYGNRYVEKVLARAKDDAGGADVSPSVEREIQTERGAGHSLDTGVRRQMESSLGANFSGVRIHTDKQADSLNHALSARAFTTGQDIFFREGAYQPGSSIGRELIAHELTHVVQQDGDKVRRAMSVSQPGDPHEVEAERTARAVMQQEHAGVSKLSDREEELAGMASRCPCEEAHRQPEAVKGKDEDEERKKHHLATAPEVSLSSRQVEPEQPE